MSEMLVIEIYLIEFFLIFILLICKFIIIILYEKEMLYN